MCFPWISHLKSLKVILASRILSWCPIISYNNRFFWFLLSSQTERCCLYLHIYTKRKREKVLQKVLKKVLNKVRRLTVQLLPGEALQRSCRISARIFCTSQDLLTSLLSTSFHSGRMPDAMGRTISKPRWLAEGVTSCKPKRERKKENE